MSDRNVTQEKLLDLASQVGTQIEVSGSEAREIGDGGWVPMSTLYQRLYGRIRRRKQADIHDVRLKLKFAVPLTPKAVKELVNNLLQQDVGYIESWDIKVKGSQN